MNLLTAPQDGVTQAANSSNYPSRSPLSAQEGDDTPPVAEDGPSLGPGQYSQPVFLACRSNISNSTDTWSSEDPFGLGVDRQEAAFLLIEFRTQMAPQFPFVVIPPDSTAEGLRREKPMLWKAVMTAASYHKPIRQEAMGWKLMEEFSTRLLMKAEKSLDLLQAMLVHLAWLVNRTFAFPSQGFHSSCDQGCWSLGRLTLEGIIIIPLQILKPRTYYSLL